MFLKNYNKIALSKGNIDISYSELFKKIIYYSNLLNINKYDKIIIYAENRLEWVYAFFAVWNKSGINIPVDYMAPKDELLYVINDSLPKIIFCSKSTEEIVKEALKEYSNENKIEIINFDNIKEENDEKIEIPEELISYNEDDTAVIIYTSGTTGVSKGVMLSFSNLLSNIECLRKEGIFTIDDIVIGILPLHHAFPLQGTMTAIMRTGGRLVFPEKLSSEAIFEALIKYKVTIIIAVPRLYKLFHKGIMDKINSNKIAKFLFSVSKKINSYKVGKILFRKVQKAFGGNIRFFVSGGAKLDENIAYDFKALGFEILEGYGMTEASPLITFSRVGQVKIGSPGKGYYDEEIKIKDGEIIVRGKNIMQGYYNKPEATKEVLKDGWLYTGDLGYFDEDGYLHITGRKKEIIVLANGKNINPEEIENTILNRFPIIKEIGVFENNNQLFAVILPDFNFIKKENIINIKETIKWMVIDKYNVFVQNYKKIYNFSLIDDELPKTRLGKLKRFILPQLFNQKEKKEINKDLDISFKEYEIIHEFLKGIVKNEVYPDDHIELDLGLDSLDRVELQSFIENSFGISLTDEDISNNSTVYELSKFIENKKTKLESEIVKWDKVLSENTEFKIKNGKFMLYLAKYLVKPIINLYFRLKVKGLENLPKSPFIIAPNHQSFIDAFLITAILPKKILLNTYFLANEKNIKSRFRNFILNNSNGIKININKDLKGTLQKVAAVLKNGKNVVIFPEGNRSRDGNLHPFKKSFAILSKELNIPIVPVTIKGAYELFPIEKKFPKPGKIEVTFLPAIYPENLDYQSITDITRENIANCLVEN